MLWVSQLVLLVNAAHERITAGACEPAAAGQYVPLGHAVAALDAEGHVGR